MSVMLQATGALFKSAFGHERTFRERFQLPKGRSKRQGCIVSEVRFFSDLLIL